jgi:SAM-dependent methyltransferase
MTSKPGMSPVHSQADPHAPNGRDARLSAPSASRNAADIVAALAGHLPAAGRVLEIAAGTGEHAVALARANPGLTWEPTDIAPERRASIDAWARAEGLGNIRPATPLDAAGPDWQAGPVAAVYLSNLLHLIPEPAAANVIAGAARALAPGGRFCLYGPFREHGVYRSEGDARFDAQLQASDPETGYKSVEWVTDTARGAGLSPTARHELPANNLILVFQNP